MRNKKASIEQIGIDLDINVIEKWQLNYGSTCRLIHADALQILNTLQIDSETVIYVDPPYLPETRLRKKVYKHDYSFEDHVNLLETITKLPCRILVSGYFSDLYQNYLSDWNIHKFKSKTHVGIRDEYVWFNYEKPSVLHDDRFIGDNFRKRELVKRRHERLKSRISHLPAEEKSKLFKWFQSEMNSKEPYDSNS